MTDLTMLENAILLLAAMAAVSALFWLIGIAELIAWRFASYRAFIRRLSH
jgi:hypothetical protein